MEREGYGDFRKKDFEGEVEMEGESELVAKSVEEKWRVELATAETVSEMLND